MTLHSSLCSYSVVAMPYCNAHCVAMQHCGIPASQLSLIEHCANI